jgi:hypothetical protein
LFGNTNSQIRSAGCRLEDFGIHWTEERAMERDRGKIVNALKNRAWDLACRRMAPGHA